MALNSDIVLIGAPGNVYFWDGTAYIFVRNGNNWQQQQELIPRDTASGSKFGISVALDGDTALVGAPEQNFGRTPLQDSAYVFVRNGNSWNQQQKLVATDSVREDDFGWYVALDSNRALIGAYAANVDGHINQGKVYFFDRGQFKVYLPLVNR